MAALISLVAVVPVRDVPPVPAVIARPEFRFAWSRAPAAARPLASWRRAPDGRLVCAWRLRAAPNTRS